MSEVGAPWPLSYENKMVKHQQYGTGWIIDYVQGFNDEEPLLRVINVRITIGCPGRLTDAA